ncbi:MAG: sulfatase [Chloroflexi bacterium]|jgi:arylsulfatase A-like enzyme|nr:sulfatase [Chloroflexota bacterium]
MTTRPNILFIMSDDHAAHAISAYGSKINNTPNIDRLAKDGIRLDSTFCTNALCTPSRATILTGQYSHINGVKTLDDEIDSSRPIQSQKLLQASGYKTAVIGKWHLGNSEGSNPQGFDYWNVLPGQGDYFDPKFYEMGEEKQYTGYVTDIITEKATDWLDSTDRDDPFFLMVHHKAPHSPWLAAPRHMNLGAEGEFPEPETLMDDYETRSEAVKMTSIRVEDTSARNLKVDPPEGMSKDQKRRWAYQRYITDYTRTIQAVDDSVGTLLDYLDENGLAENTLVIYTSDQGMFLGDHGWHDKRFMYEQSLQMPFLARLPGEIDAGSVSDAMLLNIDFAATFYDYAGIDCPDEVQGTSGRQILAGTTPDDWRTSMYYRYWMSMLGHRVVPNYGVRNERYKLIHYYGVLPEDTGLDDLKIPAEWELYDLRTDPEEIKNVYNNPEYSLVQAEMLQELDRLQTAAGDTSRH